MTNIFEGMTNLYSLSKTLRFELKPVGETKEHLHTAGIIGRDKQRDEDYFIIKPLFDDLHDKFIRESLSNCETIDWEDFIVTYNAFRNKVKSGSLEEKDKKVFQKDIENRMQILRKKIVAQFDKTAEKWKNKDEWQEEKKDGSTTPLLKEKGYKILTEQNILKVLLKLYAHDQNIVKTIERFQGFFSYFGGFNQNRENYYSDENKSTAVANRIINQNLLTFATNCTFKNQIATVEGITDQELVIFNYEYYNQCLHQDGINAYNP